MHSDGRGSSGSNNPATDKNPEWLEYNEGEVIELVKKLKRDGQDPAQIGLNLRDQYGIPSVKQLTDKTITEILEQEGMALDIPEDLQNLVNRVENIQDHLDENPEDQQARRRLELTEAKVRHIADYHKKEENISQDWEYERRE